VLKTWKMKRNNLWVQWMWSRLVFKWEFQKLSHKFPLTIWLLSPQTYRVFS
jgi:hypothetical protein